MEQTEFKISKYLDWDAVVSSLLSEIEAARDKKTEYTLYNGSRTHQFQDRMIYTFRLSGDEKINPNYITEIRFNDAPISEAQVMGIKGGKIRVSFLQETVLPDRIKMLTLISDPSFIIQELLNQMNLLRHSQFAPESLLNAVLGSQETLHQTLDDSSHLELNEERFNSRQIEAIQKARRNQVLFIWGPPGTGKTTILGKIISDLVKQDESVLLCSNTNRAVDVSMLKALEVSDFEETPIKEKSLRWGNVFLTEEEDLQYVTLPSHHKRLYEKKCEAIKVEYELLSSYDAFSPALNKLLGELKPYKMKLRKLKELEEVEAEGTINEVQLERLTELRNKLKSSSIDTDKLQNEVDQILHDRDQVENQINEEFNSVQELREFVSESTKVTLEEILADIRFHGATFARALIDDELQLQNFDNILVDEASMANLPYIIYLLTKARKRVIFVGDPQQLEPIVLSNSRAAKDWLGTDIFMRVAKADSIDSLFSWQKQNADISVLLQEQYRMPEKIYSIVNDLFYRGNLINKVNSKGTIRVFDTSELNPGLSFPSNLSHSPVNMIHSEILLGELQQALKGAEDKRVRAKEIGVMVPFTQQKRFIQYLAKTRYIPDSLEIGVVHTFQGREKPLIYMDLTLSGIDFTYPTFDESKTSVLSVSRLLNVAISRCQASSETAFDGEFVLVANYDYFRRYHNYGIVWAFLEAVREAADEFITLDTEPDPFTSGFRDELEPDLFSPPVEEVETATPEAHKEEKPKDYDSGRERQKIEDFAGDIVKAIGQINKKGEKVLKRKLFTRTDNIREFLSSLPFQICTSEAEFSVLVINLNKLIYESTGGKEANYPVRQPRAVIGEETYGKVRWVINQLRQYYAHDISTFELSSRERIESFVYEFFDHVVDDRNAISVADWTKLQISLMSQISEYLEAMYNKLKSREEAQSKSEVENE
jgi:superfamily I DNA and/or RNA helicase